MRPRSIRRRLGIGLMGAALAGAVLAGGPAVAQDATEVDVPVTAQALVSYPATDAIPDTLLGQFPPQIVCVVVPDACPESLEPVREPIAEVLRGVDANQETSPLQPANPDGLTVAYMGGTPRYASAVQFELPEVPDGEQVDEFVVTFAQGQPTFSVDSPLFRETVAAMIQLAGTQDPAAFQEKLGAALEEAPVGQPVIGIEACPLTVPVPADAAPPRSVPVRDVSEENADGELEPAVECSYNALGEFDAEAGTWSFDLTFAAKAWADGTLENHGVLLRPTGAPNLDFGDADSSTNAQVVLDIAEAPRAALASSEPPPPVETLAPMSPPSSGSGTTGGPSMVSQPPSSQIMASPPSPGSATPSTPPAEVAPPQTAPQAGGDGAEALALDPVAEPGPSTPWTVWLLVIPFAGGAWLTARSLNEQVVATGPSRGGALTRLVDGGQPT